MIPLGLTSSILVGIGVAFPSPATGSSDIQTKWTSTENKISSKSIYLYVIPLGFKPKTFRTGI